MLSIFYLMRRLILTLLLVMPLFAVVPASADQTDERLDELFARLLATSDPREARTIEHLVWGIWLQSGSDTVDLLMQRSIKAMSEGRFAEGDGLLTSIVEIKPDFAEGWNKRATLYYMMGRFDESIADVEKTLALEPRHFGALSGLGLIYSQREEWDKALHAYERALGVNPHLPNAEQAIDELTKKVKGERI